MEINQATHLQTLSMATAIRNCLTMLGVTKREVVCVRDEGKKKMGLTGIHARRL
jgi:hypothetical protein